MKHKRLLLPLVVASLLSSGPGHAADNVYLQGRVSVPGGQSKMTFRLRNTTLREALQLIAETGNLNLILDDSVQGSVSLDFFQTPLNQILESMLTANGYRLQPYGKSFVVYRSGQYGQPVMRFVPLRYVNAQAILPTLNDLLDLNPQAAQAAASPKAGSAEASESVTTAVEGAGAPSASEIRDLFRLSVKTEPRSNRIVLTGPEDRVNQAESLVRRLDVLTPSRIFPLNYVTPKEAVDVLRASFFEAGAGKAISSLQNSVPDFAAVAPGARPTQRKDIIAVSQDSPRFIPMPTQNALLVMGSSSELMLVESVLKSIDKRRPQVRIKTQIVEMGVDDSRDLGLSYKAGARQLDFDSGRSDGTFTYDTVANGALSFQVKLNALITASKVKVLASPQILAMDNRTSVIKITDQIVGKMETNITQNANNTIITRTVTPDETGVVLELTPRIDSNGGVSMSIHPVISVAGERIRNTQTGDLIATLKSTREYQAQEIYVKDGETIVIGGLIQERKDETVKKLPLLGDIPFLGGLFQTRNDTSKQTEVQIFLTPEVIKDEKPRA
ncbi:MAG TPA: secretin N-terminal domain-containing protein [Pantanalinema sp.]